VCEAWVFVFHVRTALFVCMWVWVCVCVPWLVVRLVWPAFSWAHHSFGSEKSGESESAFHVREKEIYFNPLSPVCPRLPSRTYRYLSMCVYACSETCMITCVCMYVFLCVCENIILWSSADVFLCAKVWCLQTFYFEDIIIISHYW